MGPQEPLRPKPKRYRSGGRDTSRSRKPDPVESAPKLSEVQRRVGQRLERLHQSPMTPIVDDGNNLTTGEDVETEYHNSAPTWNLSAELETATRRPEIPQRMGPPYTPTREWEEC